MSTQLKHLIGVGRLARWLGPWSSDTARPEVSIQDMVVDVGKDRAPMKLRSFFPLGRKPIGSLLMVPGMHFLGPDHPRMERLASVVAHAGIMVSAPFIPDYIDLRFAQRSVGDVQRAFDALWNHPQRPDGLPGVMSISFGCLPALALAGHHAFRERIGTLLTFGGYRHWRSALRFCLEGSADVPHDPLNRPIIFSNLAKYLPSVPDIDAVQRAWYDFMLRTWGREDMKAFAARSSIADELDTELSADGTRLFRQGCGLEDGGDELIDTAIDAAENLEWLDPGPHLKTALCPLTAVHAVDDDVIRPEQSGWLVESWPEGIEARTLLTGLYSHSGELENHRSDGGVGSALAEIKTMMSVLSALMKTGIPRT